MPAARKKEIDPITSVTAVCGLRDEAGTQVIEDHTSVVIPAYGHDWGEWTQTKAPTETEKGEEKRVCRRDPSHTETREIPAVKAYQLVSGNDGIWTKDSTDTLVFVIKSTVDDHETFGHFTGIEVDQAVPEKCRWTG